MSSVGASLDVHGSAPGATPAPGVRWGFCLWNERPRELVLRGKAPTERPQASTVDREREALVLERSMGLVHHSPDRGWRKARGRAADAGEGRPSQTRWQILPLVPRGIGAIKR